jgi:hypothetical protein
MTKIATFMTAMAAACSLAGAAMADGPISATLQTPMTSATELNAGGVVWACQGATCTVQSNDLTLFDPLDACKSIARDYGVISSFGGMSAVNLAKCNRVAHH